MHEISSERTLFERIPLITRYPKHLVVLHVELKENMEWKDWPDFKLVSQLGNTWKQWILLFFKHYIEPSLSSWLCNNISLPSFSCTDSSSASILGHSLLCLKSSEMKKKISELKTDRWNRCWIWILFQIFDLSPWLRENEIAPIVNMLMNFYLYVSMKQLRKWCPSSPLSSDRWWQDYQYECQRIEWSVKINEAQWSSQHQTSTSDFKE